MRVKINDRLEGVTFNVEARRNLDRGNAISNIIISIGFNAMPYSGFNNKEF